MSADRKLDRTISGWLEADAPSRLPDRVLRATFDQTRRTRQQRGWGVLLGRIPMNRSVLMLGGAAIVVVVAVAAFNFLPRTPGFGGTSPQPSAEPTVQPPSAAPTTRPTNRPQGLLDEGRHVLLGQGVPMSVTIPATDWFGEQGGGILTKHDNPNPPAGAGLIVFAGDDLYVYGDPCMWETTKPDSPSTSVDAFVAAMSAQASRAAAAPVDVTLGGIAGKSMTLHVPNEADFAACDFGLFGSWGANSETTPARYHQGPGQIDKLWILEVDGELVVIDAGYYEGTPQAVVDEMDAIVESMTFE